jgi:L-threonylcarbamoyladenylate synthase
MHCVSERFDFTGDELAPAYRAAVDALEAGDLVVLPTDTVYGIAADAFKADAVQRLLDAKGRGRDMPPPVLISAVETLDALATDVPESGRQLCQAFWPGPLTVICHAQSSLRWDLGETQGTVALRVPDHEETQELLSRTGPLAVSSANLSGRPAALDVYDAEAQLGDWVAVYLDGGTVTGGEPSTIVDLTGDTPYVVRVGALSVEQLREVVPEIAGPVDPAPAMDGGAVPDDNPASGDNPATGDNPASDENEASGEDPASGERAPDAEGPATGDKPAADEIPATPEIPATDDKPAADDEPRTDEGPASDDKPVDVRPAD